MMCGSPNSLLRVEPKAKAGTQCNTHNPSQSSFLRKQEPRGHTHRALNSWLPAHALTRASGMTAEV